MKYIGDAEEMAELAHIPRIERTPMDERVEDVAEMLRIIAEMQVELKSITGDVEKIRQHLAVMQVLFEDDAETVYPKLILAGSFQ